MLWSNYACITTPEPTSSGACTPQLEKCKERSCMTQQGSHKLQLRCGTTLEAQETVSGFLVISWLQMGLDYTSLCIPCNFNTNLKHKTSELDNCWIWVMGIWGFIMLFSFLLCVCVCENSKLKKINSINDPEIPLLDKYLKELKAESWRDICTPIFIEIFTTSIGGSNPCVPWQMPR